MSPGVVGPWRAHLWFLSATLAMWDMSVGHTGDIWPVEWHTASLVGDDGHMRYDDGSYDPNHEILYPVTTDHDGNKLDWDQSTIIELLMGSNLELTQEEEQIILLSIKAFGPPPPNPIPTKNYAAPTQNMSNPNIRFCVLAGMIHLTVNSRNLKKIRDKESRSRSSSDLHIFTSDLQSGYFIPNLNPGY